MYPDLCLSFFVVGNLTVNLHRLCEMIHSHVGVRKLGIRGLVLGGP